MTETVAKQTYQWLTETGRVSGEFELRVKAIGLDNFLRRCQEQWEADGSSMFMEGIVCLCV